MQAPDVINGLFELGGAAINALNIRQIIRDKQVRGVHWAPWAWFSGWGLWNLYYYPHLGQWASFSGGCLIVVINLTWLGLYWKYERSRKTTGTEAATS